MRKTALAALVSAAASMMATSAFAQGLDPLREAPRGEFMSGIAAVVNDEPISVLEVQQRMILLMAGANLPNTPEVMAAVQSQALDALINERLQLQEAAKYEVDIPQEEVDREIEQIARQSNSTREAFVAQLQSAGVPLQTLEQQLRAEIAWSAIVRGRFGSRVRVTDDQIQDTLSMLVESAAKPQYLISEILIEVPFGAPPQQVVAVVEAVYGQLREGAPFPNVARQISAAPSAAQGGDVGWVRAGEMPAEVEAALAQMQVGQVSPPIETDNGIYLVALRDQRAPVDPVRLAVRQAVVPVPADAGETEVAEAARRLDRARGRIDGCASVDRAMADVPGVVINDLDSLAPSDLSPAVRDALASFEPGATTTPVRTGSGFVLLTVCEQRVAEDANIPSREQIENRIYGQQLQRSADRMLRDLRREAMIETRQR